MKLLVSDQSAETRPALLVPAVFIATIFLSAALLFFVQPLFTKIVLPMIGGSPGVWTTAMLFFQTVLIGGYLYAHLLTRRLGLRSQVWVHLTLWAAALYCLPLGVAGDWRFDPSGSPAWQTLLIFATGVGLPFFALSANAPLIQHWYGQSGGPSAEDPYFLYGASNFGSLVALLGFPLVAEPLLGASRIGIVWAAGFIALGGFLLASGFAARRPVSQQPSGAGVTGRPKARRLAYWAFLAFVPSSLMLCVTTKISIDVGAFPLIWVVPLALYLASFTLAFSGRRMIGGGAGRWMTAGVLAAMLALFLGLGGEYLTWPGIAVLVLGFFIVAIFAHRKLYATRPERKHLTTFYLTMSVGGALGGLFNSIIAPALFSGLYEPVVTTLLAFALLISPDRVRRGRSGGLLRGALFGVLAVLPAIAVTHLLAPGNWQALVIFLMLGGVLAFQVLRSDTWASYGLAVTLFLTAAHQAPDDSVFRDRSFFGTHVVFEKQGMRLYGNGTTIHGAQRLSDADAPRPEPLFYYHPNGPMAQVLTSARGHSARDVGIVGLGVGSLACYRQPGQTWQFYEIDSLVDQVARTADYFRFLSSCTPDAPTHLGDARVVLAAQKMRYDILVIDAYSSDSVPVHLTTREAIQLYMNRLAPDGVLVFHISNRYYAIDRPLARTAADLGLTARIQTYGGHVGRDPGDTPSDVVILARQPGALGDLAADPRWRVLNSDGGRLWTDDYADLLSILK